MSLSSFCVAAGYFPIISGVFPEKGGFISPIFPGEAQRDVGTANGPPAVH